MLLKIVTVLVSWVCFLFINNVYAFLIWRLWEDMEEDGGGMTTHLIRLYDVVRPRFIGAK